MKSTLTILAVILLVLAGCGGAGGGGGGGSGGDPNALGSRDVPGGSVAVAKSGAVAAGADATFRITVSDLTPASVRAGIRVDYDTTAGTLATANGDGTWSVTVPVPSPLASGSHVWVRLVAADGSLIETGSDDFRL